VERKIDVPWGTPDVPLRFTTKVADYTDKKKTPYRPPGTFLVKGVSPRESGVKDDTKGNPSDRSHDTKALNL